MEFNSEEAAYEFYNKYALSMGFSIRKDTHTKNKRAGEITSRVFVCCKQGYLKTKTNLPKVKYKAETRTGCDAGLFIKLNMKKNNWFVNHFIESHNHPHVMQECAHMLPSQRKITGSQAMEVDLAEESRILLKSIYELMDQKNYLITKRQKDLAYGEVGYLLKYFPYETLKNPSFSIYILQKWTKQERAEVIQDMHGCEIQADPKLQQTCKYRVLCSTFTKISSRASKSEKMYKLANEHAIKMAKLIEDLLSLEMDGNKNEKIQNSPLVKPARSIEMDGQQNEIIAKRRGLKKKESSRGRHRFKSGLEIALAKKRKLSNRQLYSQMSQVEQPLQGYNVPNLVPCLPYEPSQQTSF
ncbi:hypothetical protein CICLE_v10027335mg [Citrus x clementina]|uniref:FAR1 domain-containing protein n=1 Tax=Citrus clementina TaxID=85681 RepID=V4UP63_CITCL|nr:hypothetical protein CICLE_v10027335mg [Citrus x clementina]